MSIRPVLGSRASIGGVLGSGRGGAAAAWYLAGGVSAANCVAAYAPKGAASLAASYTNLANPGTYNAAPGVAPTFDTATGWTFNGSTQYLLIHSMPITSSHSMIVRFSNGSISSYRTVAGAQNGTSASGVWFGIKPIDGSSRSYLNGVAISLSGAKASGVAAIAGTTAYLDGSAESGTMGGSISGTTNVAIGSRWRDGSASEFFPGKIQAVAIYNVTLSAAQVAAISTAMSLL